MPITSVTSLPLARQIRMDWQEAQEAFEGEARKCGRTPTRVHYVVMERDESEEERAERLAKRKEAIITLGLTPDGTRVPIRWLAREGEKA